MDSKDEYYGIETNKKIDVEKTDEEKMLFIKYQPYLKSNSEIPQHIINQFKEDLLKLNNND